MTWRCVAGVESHKRDKLRQATEPGFDNLESQKQSKKGEITGSAG